MQEEEFGDFQQISEEDAGKKITGSNLPDQPIARARMPRGTEKVGIIIQRLGGNRMEVSCSDGKTRNCRVPGKYKRALWLRPKDFVLIVPWSFDDSKGDIIYKYTPTSVNQLRKAGLLNNLNADF